MSLQDEVSRNVRVFAAARGITPTQAARKVGMPVSSMHTKLGGKVRWNVEDLERLAVAFDITPQRLVEGLADFKWSLPSPIMTSPPRSGPRQLQDAA
jgi:hypothetical protein